MELILVSFCLGCRAPNFGRAHHLATLDRVQETLPAEYQKEAVQDLLWQQIEQPFTLSVVWSADADVVGQQECRAECDARKDPPKDGLNEVVLDASGVARLRINDLEVEEEVTQVFVPAGRTTAGRGRCVSLARAAAGTSGRSLAGVPTLSSKTGGRTQI